MGEFHKVIAEINFNHEYFANRKLTGFSVEPFPETAAFFRNYRMIFRKKENQYYILQEADSGNKEPTIKLDGVERDLFFGINFNDPQYQLRSGLNFDPRSEKVVLRILQDENYAVSEHDVMSVINKIAPFDDPGLVILDENGNTVFSLETETALEYSRLNWGIYSYNGRRFLKCDRAAAFDAVLIFRLTDSEQPLLKKITFPAGQYIWRYKIQKKYTSHTALSLVDENEKVQFNSLDAKENEILTFLSDRPVQVSELSPSMLAIYNSDQIVKKFLPVPGLDSARFLSDTERTLVLEAYITI
jgi:hypothetical protein